MKASFYLSSSLKKGLFILSLEFTKTLINLIIFPWCLCSELRVYKIKSKFLITYCPFRKVPRFLVQLNIKMLFFIQLAREKKLLNYFEVSINGVRLIILKTLFSRYYLLTAWALLWTTLSMKFLIRIKNKALKYIHVFIHVSAESIALKI